MKSLFFNLEDLNILIKELFNNENVKIGFSEEFEEDVVEWYNESNTEVIDITFVEELFALMNEKYNVTIESLEIIEYEPLKFGYMFPFK